MKKVIVIGAGFGGLATAAQLAYNGYDVTIYEKNEQVGGRASVFSENGFLFDMGPSWYLMPDVFERFFANFGKKPSDYYTLTRLDPSYRIFFDKNDYLDISSDLTNNFALFESLEKDGAKKLQKYLDESKQQYETSMKHFMYRSFDKVFDPTLLNVGPDALKLRIFKNIDTYTKQFFTSEKARKILEYNIVFLGGSLKNTPALYSIMAHIDFNMGVWYPMGGIGEIVNGIKKLCEELGVKIRLNTPVNKILVEDDKAVGVDTPQGIFKSDIVITNADYHHAQTQLLEEKYQTYPKGYWKKATIAPSAFIAYLGINKQLKGLQHHNLFLYNDWVKHFDAIFDSPSWPENPSYYVCAPSKTDSKVAPKAMENLFVLVPVAAGLEDTDEIRDAYFEKIMAHLESLIGENIRDHIVVKKLFSHRDFAARYNSYKGTALGLTHSLFQSAWFRPHHTSKKVKNLYFAGQYTHPGIGVPTQLIVSEVIRDLVVNLDK